MDIFLGTRILVVSFATTEGKLIRMICVGKLKIIKTAAIFCRFAGNTYFYTIILNGNVI